MLIFYMIILLLTPATMAGFGFLWRSHAPKTINSTYGYRTERSMKSPAAWEFAHHYVGRVWLYGSLPAALSAAILYLYRAADENVMGLVVLAVIALQMVFLLVPIPLTERALKKCFDEYGRRKRSQA